METENIRTRVRATYQQGSDAVVEFVVALMSELTMQVETVAARVAAVEGENAALRAENAALRVVLGTNSHNSGKPPSSDGPGVKPHPKSQRVVSGRKSGGQPGQPGHEGHTLALVDAPDEVRVQAPSHCQECGHGLDDVSALRRERRQVVDSPPVRARVIEHQAVTRCCRGCGAETSGTFPPEVAAPVQYGLGVATLAVYFTQEQLLPLARTSAVLAEVFGCPATERTVESAVETCHERLAEVEVAIKQGVTEAKVAHVDETGVNITGQTAWLHVASTAHLTFYAAHHKRGRAAMDEIGIAPRFRGRAVHDGLASYWQYRQCAPALCNAHHLRELTFVEEHLGQHWAKDLKEVLREIKQAVDDARGQGLTALPTEARQAFARRSDALLEEGMRANPPPPLTGQRG